VGLVATATAVAASGTILVVDDDPSVVLLLRTLFEENGYRVLGAGNGQEAIRAHAEHGPVDLIVTDIDMPRMDGLGMCRWLQGNHFAPPIIVISGLDVSPEHVCGTSPSVAGFLRKPFAMSDLLEMAVATMA